MTWYPAGPHAKLAIPLCMPSFLYDGSRQNLLYDGLTGHLLEDSIKTDMLCDNVSRDPMSADPTGSCCMTIPARVQFVMSPTGTPFVAVLMGQDWLCDGATKQ